MLVDNSIIVRKTQAVARRGLNEALLRVFDVYLF